MEHNMLGVAIFCGLYYAFAGWRPLYLTHSIWLFPLTSALKCSPSQGHFHLTHSGSIPAGYSPVVM